MNVIEITESHLLWLKVAEYAESCSWDACKRMATHMKNSGFTDWERLFVAEENGYFEGFCALLKAQPFPGDEYRPLLKWLFVDEKYRGHRLSESLIDTAADYAKSIGFDKLYLTTWHIDLYEKYGFVKLCDKEVREGYSEGIYEKCLTDEARSEK
ncbi:MAG: GNAT family N-acetyltransferase [Ruminococcus sp.]|jgi:GNAT superfamily N-acetyltransferase|nr:GNAT family N-acetyltransferase [Ruminococcus sp.]